MSDYGVLPTGFARKPLVTTLKEIETDMIEVFGEGIIQTSESPLGQINGLMADKINDLWELAEDVYQSFDPDQAEGTRLTSIAKLRLLQRGAFDDIGLRTEINNEGVNKYNLKGVEQKLLDVEGITYLKAFLNDDGSMTPIGLALGDVAIAVIGGADSDIADELVKVLPIGGTTYGSTVVTSSVESEVSQAFNIERISTVRVELALQLSLLNDAFELFTPDIQQVIEGFVQQWLSDRINGRDVDSFTIRRLIECKYPNIELIAFTATVDGGSAQAQNAPVVIDFDEIADIVSADVTAVFV